MRINSTSIEGMKRRKFAKLATLGAVAISAFGFINFNGRRYEGSCETTTDILGPFYRPDSPVRSNLVLKDAPGDIVELSGTIRQKDCVSALKNAKVELWHCSFDEVYDNESDDYRYRGTQYTNSWGSYRFITQMPVPYEVRDGNYRPAHFHLMISAKGFQTLVTQIYFTGDPYLQLDGLSSAPKAKKRILTFEEEDSKKSLIFDVNMNDRLDPSPESLDKLVGVYVDKQSGYKEEFFAAKNQLWKKNEVFGEFLSYLGDNNFEQYGLPKEESVVLKFDLLNKNNVNLTITVRRKNAPKPEMIFKLERV